MRRPPIRTICFVTGTRAEFGLMRSVMDAIEAHPRLKLRIIATGMHLDPHHGSSIRQIRRERRFDATVPWPPAGDDRDELARQTGLAVARLARAFQELQPDVVLVVGDRVEAFAAATAAHLAGRIVAHIHGGDRALGQVDDALRHAITKLAHVHFPATAQSARRLVRLGEDPWRIHTVGSPGIDGIAEEAMAWNEHQPITLALAPWRYALFALHPTGPDEKIEYRRARIVLQACERAGLPGVVGVYPNNDPGSGGIFRALRQWKRPHTRFHANLPRPAFLGLLRDAAVLVGNSSSGIIEAASFGTPVIDVGDRQKGRQHGRNVLHADFDLPALAGALREIWNGGRPRRSGGRNIYGTGDAGRRIAAVLSRINIGRMTPKLIAY